MIAASCRVAVTMCLSTIAAIILCTMTSSVEGAVIGTIAAALPSYFLADWLVYWRRLSPHSDFYKRLEGLLEPPNLCPVSLEDARTMIIEAIEEARILSEELLAGSYIEWARYSELLESSLGYSNLRFFATCFLSPVQFMDGRFARYRGVQEKLPSGFLGRLLFPRRRFRIVAVDKRSILEDHADEEKRRIMQGFFDWHDKEDIPIYAMSREEFRNLHQNTFKDLELNDFVYFATDNCKWVVGGLVDYDEPRVTLEDMAFVKVVTSASGSIEDYRRFTQRLLKKHAERMRSLEELVKWCSL